MKDAHIINPTAQQQQPVSPSTPEGLSPPEQRLSQISTAQYLQPTNKTTNTVKTAEAPTTQTAMPNDLAMPLRIRPSPTAVTQMMPSVPQSTQQKQPPAMQQQMLPNLAQQAQPSEEGLDMQLVPQSTQPKQPPAMQPQMFPSLARQAQPSEEGLDVQELMQMLQTQTGNDKASDIPNQTPQNLTQEPYRYMLNQKPPRIPTGGVENIKDKEHDSKMQQVALTEEELKNKFATQKTLDTKSTESPDKKEAQDTASSDTTTDQEHVTEEAKEMMDERRSTSSGPDPATEVSKQIVGGARPTIKPEEQKNTDVATVGRNAVGHRTSPTVTRLNTASTFFGSITGVLVIAILITAVVIPIFFPAIAALIPTALSIALPAMAACTGTGFIACAVGEKVAKKTTHKSHSHSSAGNSKNTHNQEKSTSLSPKFDPLTNPQQAFEEPTAEANTLKPESSSGTSIPQINAAKFTNQEAQRNKNSNKAITSIR